jgi:hypothetical protein
MATLADTYFHDAHKIWQNSRQRILELILIVFILIFLIIILWIVYPVGVDWKLSYHASYQHFRSPYKNSAFAGISWILFMLPHALLGVALGNSINFAIHIIVLGAIIWKNKGGWLAVVLTFTSPLFLDLARTNNVDWVPALAFLLPPMWGLPLLLAKPQTLGAAALIWWKQKRFSLKMLLPTLAIALFSFLIWGNWLPAMFAAGKTISGSAWNFAPFPFGLPIGAYLLSRAYKANDDILAAAASPFLFPYFAPYSLAPLLALLASKYKVAALFIYFGFWYYFLIESHRIVFYVGK